LFALSISGLLLRINSNEGLHKFLRFICMYIVIIVIIRSMLSNFSLLERMSSWFNQNCIPYRSTC